MADLAALSRLPRTVSRGARFGRELHDACATCTQDGGRGADSRQVGRKRFDVEIPDGQHLGFSRDTGGARRAHLFDDESNDLVGHAELFEPDEEEPSPPSIEYVYASGFDAAEEAPRQLSDEDKEFAEALVTLGIITAAVAAPYVKKWWTDKVVPTFKAARGGLKSTCKRVSYRRKDHSPNSTRVAASVVDPAPVQSSRELAVASQDSRIRMSSVEARERFVAALVAREFTDAQMKILRDAQIEDDEGPVELEGAIRALTPQDVAETLKGILERNPSLLDRGTLTELGPILGGGRTDGEYVPLKIERLKDAPRTTDRHPES